MGKGSAERRRRWCSCFCVIGGAADGEEESKSDLTDQEGVLSIASRSASGGFDFEDMPRRVIELVVHLYNDQETIAGLTHRLQAIAGRAARK